MVAFLGCFVDFLGMFEIFGDLFGFLGILGGVSQVRFCASGDFGILLALEI